MDGVDEEPTGVNDFEPEREQFRTDPTEYRDIASKLFLILFVFFTFIFSIVVLMAASSSQNTF